MLNDKVQTLVVRKNLVRIAVIHIFSAVPNKSICKYEWSLKLLTDSCKMTKKHKFYSSEETVNDDIIGGGVKLGVEE